MKRKLWLPIGFLAVLSLLVAACGASPTPEGNMAPAGELTKNADGYTDISVEQLATMLESKDFTLVNVHIPYEGEISQTDLFVPFDEIADYQDQFPDKDASIVLYCRSDRMSTISSETLVGLGYTNIYNLVGGMVDWENAGLELEN